MVPWPVFLVSWQALLGHLALDRLMHANAGRVARMDGADAERAFAETRRDAFPGT